MKVSKYWLEQLVKLKVPLPELIELINLRTIGTKEINDQFIELDMKGYNRADLLSTRGVAYEAAAISGSEVTFDEPDPDHYIWEGQNLSSVNTFVEDQNLCPLYCIAKIEGLKVEKSPDEWVQKLQDSGMRSINTIADVTNLVMLEYGQPLHAFDAEKVENETLIVKTAENDEEITTLDGKKRVLQSSDLLITDELKALGIAGVMGGEDSEVKNSTHTILLEAAIFDPVSIRKTATRLALPSEASKRFQHGLTKIRTLQALDAAIRYYQQLGGTLTGISIIDKLITEEKPIVLRKQKAEQLIGIPLTKEQILSFLEPLHFQLTEIEEGIWEVTKPYWRLDIEIEEDLIEEIARMYGYEKIPSQPIPNTTVYQRKDPLFSSIDTWKGELATKGITEIETYSFFPSMVINALNRDPNSLVKIANPISSETEYIRDQLWPNVLEAAIRNLKQQQTVELFEVGKVFSPRKEGVPHEEYRLAIILSDHSNNPLALLHKIMSTLSINDLVFTNEKSNNTYSHPVRNMTIMVKGEKVGELFEVHPRIIHKLGYDGRIVVSEISLDKLHTQ